ncbi:site-specific integrase [Aquabacterium humicola]|uniref:site-specific integrase n=1 Tax=Aquabacterium humicola TaxID=3237377 RepID=UPI0025439914|nr:site-specific integrase [Rubrivivax pictus]
MDNGTVGGRRRTTEQTIQMLREVLNGEPYSAVSARRGISRSAVERRVKALAVQITQAVGVDGLQAEGAAFVQRLRARRDAILASLERFDPERRGSRRAARVLAVEEVRLGALRVRSRSSRPNHDLALYHLLFATGMRPLEIARLKVGDYLRPDGEVRRESLVRAEVAINGKERPLLFAHRRLDEALAAYLDERVNAGHGLGSPGAWRGLDPGSPLFLDAAGAAYPITSNGSAGQDRHVCRALLDIYRRLFRQADMRSLSAQSARLTLMSRMYARGADEDQVGLVLGIADRSAVREQLARPRAPLAQLLDDAE